jgi:tetratricopeptide (TPR) repeat protein
MKRALFAGLVVCLALVSTAASAQSGSARGKVVDEKGQGVPEAKVLIEFAGGVTRKFETKSNKKGEFIQVGMAPGPYKFTATKDGFQGTFVETRVSLGDATQIPDLVLKAAGSAGAGGGGASAADVLRAEFKQALDLTQAGKLDEAEAAYKGIAAKDPTIPEVYQNLGYVYSQKKDWANAEAALSRALELKPGSSELSSALAKVYQDSGQPDKAMAVMSKAAGENPADARAQFNMGIFHLNAGKSEEAICAFHEAIQADPSIADAYYHMGTLMVGQNKIPEAVAFLQQFLCASPTNSQNVTTAQGLLKALGAKQSEECASAGPTRATYLQALGAKQSEACAGAGPTLATYNALAEGMALAEVRKLVKSPGVEVSRTGNLVTLVWKAKDGGSLITTFDNDRLVSKSQTNLK